MIGTLYYNNRRDPQYIILICIGFNILGLLFSYFIFDNIKNDIKLPQKFDSKPEQKNEDLKELIKTSKESKSAKSENTLSTLINQSVEEPTLSTTNINNPDNKRRTVLYKRAGDTEFKYGQIEDRYGYKVVYVTKEFFQEKDSFIYETLDKISEINPKTWLLFICKFCIGSIIAVIMCNGVDLLNKRWKFNLDQTTAIIITFFVIL